MKRRMHHRIGLKGVTGMLAAVLVAGIVVVSGASGSSRGTGASASAGRVGSAATASGLTVNTSLHGTVYFLWPNTSTPGWPQYYIPTMINAFKHYLPKVKLVQENANDSQSTQLSQVQAAITQKASLVIISPPTPTQAGGELKSLAAAHIPAIGYLNDPDGGPAFAYVWVNFSAVGDYWGKYLGEHVVKLGHKPVRLALVLGDPTFSVYNQWLAGINPELHKLVANGRVKVVCRFNTVGWVPATAQSEMQQCLSKTGNGVDAVLAMNDSTSDGAAAALTSANLLGKVPIYGGHDGDVTVIQRILAGDQAGTFHPDGVQMGKASAALAEAALTRKSAQSSGFINASFNNHFQKGGVPTVEAREILVNKSNVKKTVIDDGILTKKQICTGGVAAHTAFCAGS